jgi:ABC-2 type transport system ATP-binding protein
MQSAIWCQDLRKTYAAKPPVEALVGIDLSVSRGECFGLLGPNGAGKTTTIEILEGLLEATSGEVEILGMSWAASPSAIKNRIGISLQETKLAEKLSVRETLTLFRSFYTKGMSADEAIALVSLEEKAESWVGKLSGGQKQRLAVATALVGDPDLLFLDEPTTGLDPQSRRQLWDIIRQLRQRGRTVLLTTHYMDEAERLCDRIAVVDHGKIIALGSPRELIAGLGGEHVIEFSLDGESPDATFAALPGVRSVAHEGPTIRLTVSETHVTLKALLSELSKADIELTSLTTRHASLEDVFVSLTGRHLRDDSGDDADAP